MTLATETADYLTSLSREAFDHARRHGFVEFDHGSDDLELWSFRGSLRAVFRVVSEREARLEVSIEDYSTGEVEWSEERNGHSFLRNYDDPAAEFLDDLDGLLAAAKQRL